MRKLLLAAAIAAAAVLAAPAAEAQPVMGKWSICDLVNPTRCITLSPLSSTINIAAAGTVKLIPGVSGKATLITAWDVVTAANFQLEYGTTTTNPCDTGTTALTGTYAFGTSAPGISKGNGQGVVLPVPAGQDVCAVAAGAAGGSITYQQTN